MNRWLPTVKFMDSLCNRCRCFPSYIDTQSLYRGSGGLCQTMPNCTFFQHMICAANKTLAYQWAPNPKCKPACTKYSFSKGHNFNTMKFSQFFDHFVSVKSQFSTRIKKAQMILPQSLYDSLVYKLQFMRKSQHIRYHNLYRIWVVRQV